MQEKYSAEFIAKRLDKPERRGDGWRCCCPAHPDENPSLDIKNGDRGVPIFKCRANCTQSAILQALRDKGLWLDPPRTHQTKGAKRKPRPERRLVATYDYRDPAGVLRYQKLRYDPKDFAQRRPDGKGGWLWNLRGVELVPYRLPELKKAIAAGRQVCIVEGEKDADNLVKLGFEATTGPMGAGKWSPQLCPHFTGARVVIIPDNDGPGRGHPRLVGGALRDFAVEVLVLELPDLPEGGDVSDWIANGGNAKLLGQLIECTALPWADWLADQPVHKETEQETLARLAALSAFEYDRIREVEAQALNVRPATLDKEVAKARGQATEAAEDAEVDDFLVDPEPWPESVDLADLLDRIVDAAKAHLVLPPGAAEVIALWAVFAHAHDAFHISPYLTATSPTPECGKSTLLTFVSGLVPKPAAASNFTTAVIFRIIEAWGPTLMIDEADTYLRDNIEMRGVLNGAHMRSAAYAARVIDAGDDHKPKFFPTWGPKFIALIGKLPVTLASRSIHIEMHRKKAGETIQPLRADRIDHLKPLCRQAARWWLDNSIRLGAIEPEIPMELYGRAADNWRPIIAIADAAGGEWPERARQIAVKLGGRRDEQTSSIMLLEDIKAIFVEHGLDRIFTADLIDKLTAIEQEPWVEWNRGKPITAHQIAKLLKQFRIVPNTIRTGVGTAKGYLLEQFHDAFSRYTGDLSVTPSQPSKSPDFGPRSSVTQSADVTDKKPEKPSNSAACDGVTDKLPPSGQNGHCRCALCGDSDLPGDQVGSFGSNPTTWLHQRCWLEWRNLKENGGSVHDGAAGGPL